MDSEIPDVTDLSKPLHYKGFVGLWRRLLAYVLDLIILGIPAIFLYRYLLKLSLNLDMVIPFILYYLMYFIFIAFLTVKKGGTPGKVLLGYRVVNKGGFLLTWRQAVIRQFINMFHAIIWLLSFHKLIIEGTIIEGVYEGWNVLIGFLFIFDALWLVLHRYKRSLHDIMAQSYVVTINFIPMDHIKIYNQERKPSFIRRNINTLLFVISFLIIMAFMITAILYIMVWYFNYDSELIANIGASSLLILLLFTPLGIGLCMFSYITHTMSYKKTGYYLTLYLVVLITIVIFIIIIQ